MVLCLIIVLSLLSTQSGLQYLVSLLIKALSLYKFGKMYLVSYHWYSELFDKVKK